MIFFFHPSHAIGGAETQYARYANALVAAGEAATVSVEPGSPLDALCDRAVRRLPANAFRIGDGVLVTSPAHVPALREQGIPRDTRVLFWYLSTRVAGAFAGLEHAPPRLMTRADTTITGVWRTLFPTEFARGQAHVARANEAGSDAFMDLSAHAATERLLDVKLEPRVLPVVITAGRRRAHTVGDELHVTWIGRLEVSWKVVPLVDFLRTLSRTDPRRKIVVHLVGGTSEKARADLQRAAGRLDVVFHGPLFGPPLDAVLARTDVMVGHGASLLEATAAGLPALIVDASYAHRRSWPYRWFHEAGDLDVGWLLESFRRPPVATETLDVTLARVVDSAAAWDRASQASYDKTVRLHTVSAGRLRGLADGATLAWGEVADGDWAMPSARVLRLHRGLERLAAGPRALRSLVRR